MKYPIAIFLSLQIICLQGQPLAPRVIPPTPEASAYAKYGEFPVSTYTGIPQISIPLHQIHLESLELPITLNYHAGGIKVEELASRAGLGWTLQAGGLISRTMRGLPDEWENVGYQDLIKDNALETYGITNFPMPLTSA